MLCSRELARRVFRLPTRSAFISSTLVLLGAPTSAVLKHRGSWLKRSALRTGGVVVRWPLGCPKIPLHDFLAGSMNNIRVAEV